MSKLFTLVLLTLVPFIMSAQTIAGEYYLKGVMETASGFKLEADSTFQFFFSQGALDRVGKGKWTVQNNQITFNSENKPERDFALINSKKEPGNTITIKVTDRNETITKYVFAVIKSNGKTVEQSLENNGQATFHVPSVDSLTLIFQFCPEKTSTFRNLPSGHNYFEFRFERWMLEYHFLNFSLKYDGTNLIGAHPMLEEKTYTFEKAENQ